MTVGLLLIMFTVEVNWLMYPGIIFLTSGSFSLLVTNQPLSQLEPRATAIIIAFGMCIFQFSFSTFRLWEVLFDFGVQYKTIVTIHLSFTIVHWIRTFFLMPLGPGLTL